MYDKQLYDKTKITHTDDTNNNENDINTKAFILHGLCGNSNSISGGMSSSMSGGMSSGTGGLARTLPTALLSPRG